MEIGTCRGSGMWGSGRVEILYEMVGPVDDIGWLVYFSGVL